MSRTFADWSSEGTCASTDPALFFPGQAEWHLAKAAIQVCRRCPVRRLCLEYALERPELGGVWGATTNVQRQKLRVAAAA